MPFVPPTGFDDETVAWGYAPPRHLEGEPDVPIPDQPPGSDIAPNQPVRMPSGVVAYRETASHRQQVVKYEQQAAAARQAAEQAARDAQMLDQMSRVATSMKDIEVARRTIDVLGLQRDVDNAVKSGIPIQRALYESAARHPMALGSGYGTALKNLMPPAQPTVVPPSGTTPGYVQDPRGVPHFFPASSQEHALDTTGAVLKDPESGRRLGAVYRTGPNTQHIILDKVPNNVTPAIANSIYNAQERSLIKELESVAAFAALRDTTDPQHAYFTDLQKQLTSIRQNRAALLGPKSGGTAVPAPDGGTKPVAVLGQGTRNDPARPTTADQFASLPSGAWFVNPKDGKLMQKK